jgi:hypothetical protein
MRTSATLLNFRASFRRTGAIGSESIRIRREEASMNFDLWDAQSKLIYSVIVAGKSANFADAAFRNPDEFLWRGKNKDGYLRWKAHWDAYQAAISVNHGG